MQLIMKLLMDCHNPYFNRWFSAIKMSITVLSPCVTGHNPYFNRWFSAIKKKGGENVDIWKSQSLF